MVTLIGLTRKVIAMIDKYKAISLIMLGVSIFVTILVDIITNILRDSSITSWVFANIKIVDYTLYISFLISVLSYFIYLHKTNKSLRYSFGKTLFYYSLFVLILIWLTVEVANGITYLVFKVTLNHSGFPWWSESVTSTSCLIKMSNYSSASNCWFLNYGDLLVISIIGAVIGYMLYIKED